MMLIWLIPVVMAVLGAGKYVRIAVLGVILINLVNWFLVSKMDLSDIFKSGLISKQAESIKKRVELLLSDEKRITLFVPDYLDSGFSSDLDALIKACSLCSLREQPITALLLNCLMPFDLMCADRLFDWSAEHGKDFMKNVENLGQIEALMCACVPGLISAEACYPVIVEDKKAYFSGSDMSHPLLDPSKVVSNSVTVDSEKALITGSNMSGKTTLIRTAGLMTVLAYTGSMVPATSVSCSIMKVMTSMRIADSLEENMSTFKAELVRIASIVEAASSDSSLLFLIDEVFRGTNSQDRTDGAQILLNKLNKPQIAGFMTTHDYALCDRVADEKMENIIFCHFSERYEGDEVIFDYKLKPGMSHESNAKFLMKLVGII
jgi:DNA mismatch repair ATPase MutS